MAYKGSTLTGTSWVRSYKFEGRNPLNGIPSITFYKERVKELSDGTRTATTDGDVTKELLDPNEALVLRHPVTNEVIGESTMMQMHVMLFSLFMQMDSAQDAPASAGQG